MYIKSNVIATSLLLLSSSLVSGFELSTTVSVGVKTNQYYIQNEYLTGAPFSYKPSNFEYWPEVSQAFGYKSPEFFDVDIYSTFSVYHPEVYLEPYMHLALFNHRADIGGAVYLKKPIFHNDINLKAYADLYTSLFLQDISPEEQQDAINLDFGAEVDYGLTEYSSLYLNLRHPFYVGAGMLCYDETIQIVHRPNIELGLRFSLLATFGDLVDEMPSNIIQEPISIPVVNLVVEEPVEEVAAVIFEEPVAEVEEELGWFAWIIEFIARLFRF